MISDPADTPRTRVNPNSRATSPVSHGHAPLPHRHSGSLPLIIAAALLLCAYIAVTTLTGWMPPCPFKYLTGYDCPGCGSQRALMALLHGHPLEAWSYNWLLPPAVAYIVLLIVAPRHSRLSRVLQSPTALWLLLTVILLWTLLRNLI